ncbi:unnamed protein product [Gadus morhua 'NCC']
MIRGLWYREPLVPGSIWYQEEPVVPGAPGTRGSSWYQEPLVPGSIPTRLQQESTAVFLRGTAGMKSPTL